MHMLFFEIEGKGSSTMLTLNYKYLRLSLVGLGLLHDKLASAVSTYQYIWCSILSS